MAKDNNRLAYEGKIEARLKEWGSQIDDWLERTPSSSILDDLNSKRQVVRRKLTELREAGDGQWQWHQAEMDKAVEEMDQAIKAAGERFQQA